MPYCNMAYLLAPLFLVPATLQRQTHSSLDNQDRAKRLARLVTQDRTHLVLGEIITSAPQDRTHLVLGEIITSAPQDRTHLVLGEIITSAPQEHVRLGGEIITSAPQDPPLDLHQDPSLDLSWSPTYPLYIRIYLV